MVFRRRTSGCRGWIHHSGSPHIAEQAEHVMPYLTMVEEMPYQTKVAVTDEDKLTTALLNSSNTIATPTVNFEYLFDTVSVVVCEDYIMSNVSDNIYDIGTIQPGQTKDVWIVPGIMHFDIHLLDMPTFNEELFYNLPMKEYAGDDLKEDTSLEMYFHDTGEESTAHA